MAGSMQCSADQAREAGDSIRHDSMRQPGYITSCSSGWTLGGGRRKRWECGMGELGFMDGGNRAAGQ